MDVRAVLNAVAKTAARLCDGNDAVIFQAGGDQLRLVAKYGPLRATRTFDQPFPISRGTTHGRAVECLLRVVGCHRRAQGTCGSLR